MITYWKMEQLWLLHLMLIYFNCVQQRKNKEWKPTPNKVWIPILHCPVSLDTEDVTISIAQLIVEIISIITQVFIIITPLCDNVVEKSENL